jgi:hypothetical protein
MRGEGSGGLQGSAVGVGLWTLQNTSRSMLPGYIWTASGPFSTGQELLLLLCVTYSKPM